LTTAETVAVETPAALATSNMVGKSHLAKRFGIKNVL
jgi:hypothetical protein